MNRQLHDLAELVRQMREAQQQYFIASRRDQNASIYEWQARRDERRNALSASKELERRVDKEVSDILDSQGKLFE